MATLLEESQIFGLVNGQETPTGKYKVVVISLKWWGNCLTFWAQWRMNYSQGGRKRRVGSSEARGRGGGSPL